ncbi:MAG: DUF3987 domain-containing protein [Bacteroidales bacterium]|nr:DUF3987 domain-containing protein [Bacteroidales bacterium]
MAYYFKSVSAKGQLLTRELFFAATHDEGLLPLYRQIAGETDNGKRGELKKRLPGITWQADFPKGRRKNDEAVATGLFIVDIDHIDKPEAVYQEKIAYRLVKLGVMAVHCTPSCHGLRVVARCRKDCHSIEENQRWFAQQTGLAIDAAVKDLARFSYLVPHTYFYYLDDNIWTMENVAVENNCKDEPATAVVLNTAATATANDRPNESETEASRNVSTGLQTHYKGLALTDIAMEWLKSNGGLPQEGERNTVLHRLAFSLRYITEFKAEVVAAAIPHCGLTDAEVLSLCQSACNAQRSSQMPRDLKVLLYQMLKEGGDKDLSQDAATPSPAIADDADDPHDEEYLARLPKLPLGLNESLSGVPDKVKVPILCGIMPLAMTYATNVSYQYCDGKQQRLNMMCVVYGKQASGKSAVKDVVEVWRKPMKVADAEARQQEDEYKQLKKGRKANEKLPPEPKTFVQGVAVTISNSGLLKRMKNAAGRHVFSFGEELDTLRKSNGAGSWSAKYDLYRMAFDNGEWGQDYVSDNSESGMVNVAYNWTILGTYGAVKKLFVTDNVENGLGGRILFSMMPSRNFEDMPTYEERDPMIDEKIYEAVTLLSSYKGFVDTPRLRKEMTKWCNEEAAMARADKDIVRDTFRKRACVIGFRCGVVFHLLQNDGDPLKMQPESKACVDFAKLMAEYALKYQMELFGEQLLENVTVLTASGRKTKNKSLFDELPVEFSMQDILALRPDLSNHGMRQMVYVWNRDELIEKVGKNHWRKKRKDE